MTARFTDWTHVRVVGDREAAAPFVGEARKLLGAVFEEAARNDLGTHVMRRELPDGTVIVAEKFGDIPRMTIVPTSTGETVRPPPGPDAFVVWARDLSQPDGIDPEHPQQILRPGWTTWFYSGEVAGYEGFEGPKGTYLDAFPDGVRHAGNVDWRGPAGERLSWYGPSTRYWVDPYIQPRAQYGKQVFLLGQVLLDIEAYIAASDPLPAFAERYVMGAALDGLDLIVVLADLPVETTPSGAAPANTISVPSPWSLAEVPTTICRFRVVLSDQQVAARMRISPGSRHVMWSGSTPRGTAPWFFNESATRAVCLGLPESCAAMFSSDLPAPGLAGAPSPSSPLWQAVIGDETASVVQSVIALPAIGAQAVLAADFRGDALVQLEVRRRSHAASIEAFALLQAGVEIPLNAEELIAGPNHQRVTFRYVLHADAREDVIVCARIQVESSGGTVVASSCAVEVWRDGDVAESVPFSFAEAQNFGLGRRFVAPDRAYSDSTRGVPVSPHYALYRILSGREQFTSFIRWQGLHGLYSNRAYPVAAEFGAYANTGPVGGNYIPIANSNDAGFNSDRVDFDEHGAVLGCASHEGVTMLSCYGYGANGTANNGRSIHCVDGTDLRDLTGVGGESARFHPIWLLGRPPALLA